MGDVNFNETRDTRHVESGILFFMKGWTTMTDNNVLFCFA